LLKARRSRCWRLITGVTLLAVFLMPFAAAVAAETEYVDAGRGNVRVVRPSDFDPAEPLPVVILLHAFGYSANFEESYLQFSAHVDSHRFILGIPDGSRNLTFQRYWNATDACCDIFGQGPDDSGYLRELIDVMSDVYEVDPRRIHLVGHSNGGFMAHRMICDHPGLIAGIATLASATFNDPDACVLGEPVHVLQAHGTIDPVILYGGGCLVGGCYPSASLTQRYVADDNGCGRTPDETPEPLDLIASIPGDETTVSVFATSCSPGGAAELWTIPGVGHNPPFGTTFSRLVVEWFLDRPKPGEPGDLNGDGRVDAADLGLLLVAWGRCSGCPADLDGDGQVGGSDLGLMIALWSV
jgi:polyhydroxybutyrate depolymerase